MALLIAGIIAAGAGIGSLLTYSGVKFFADSPSKEHVQTVVKNEIAAHIDADGEHETFQNQLLIILVAIVAFAAVLFILHYVVIGVRTARQIRRENNNNVNMHAINIDA